MAKTLRQLFEESSMGWDIAFDDNMFDVRRFRYSTFNSDHESIYNSSTASNFDLIRSSLVDLKGKRDELKYELNALNSELQQVTADIDNLSNTVMDYKQIAIILTECSHIKREYARNQFEKIITEALQFVTQSNNYEFVIQEKEEASKASYEFYVKTIINGEESLQNPKDANGGGFIDIISVAAKYAYLQLFDNPTIMNSSILLDEPGKMIDEQRSISFAEYIKELGKTYDRQTIMITHNNTLADVADKTYYVSLDNDMSSTVSELEDIPLENIENVVKEDLNGH